MRDLRAGVEDVDGDGVKDIGEPGLEGWVIYIDSNGNNTLDGAAAPITAASTDVPKQISESLPPAISEVNFEGVGTVVQVEVTLDINHSFVGDLTARYPELAQCAGHVVGGDVDPLDTEAMHRAAQALVGRHDFTTFRSAHCQAKDPVKTLDRLDVRREGDHVIVEAAARSFLHHQVRSMAGTLALVGQGQWREEQVAEALAAKDRAALGLNAPSEGLYFVRAIYPEEEQT
mgnify:CR=1 FL=1